MLNFLDAILNAIDTFSEFVSNIITGLMSLIAMIPQAMGVVTVSINALPFGLVGFALAGIGICIVFQLIGR